MVGMHLPYQEDFPVSLGHGYSKSQTVCATLHPGDVFHSAKHLTLGASTLSKSLIRYMTIKGKWIVFMKIIFMST